MAIDRLLVDTSKNNNGIFNCFATVRSTQKKMAIEFQTCPEFGQAFRVEYWTYFKKIKFIFYFPKNGFSSPPWKFWAGSGQACPEILSAVFSRKMIVIYKSIYPYHNALDSDHLGSDLMHFAQEIIGKYPQKLSICIIWDPIRPKTPSKLSKIISILWRKSWFCLDNYLLCQSFSLPKEDGNRLTMWSKLPKSGQPAQNSAQNRPNFCPKSYQPAQISAQNLTNLLEIFWRLWTI